MKKQIDVKLEKKFKAQDALCRKLGADYKIVKIDFERCIYRDFGNGFNVEISGTCTTLRTKKATLFLWLGSSYCVCGVKNVDRDDIGKTADSLYDYSENLIKRGLTTKEAIVSALGRGEL